MAQLILNGLDHLLHEEFDLFPSDCQHRMPKRKTLFQIPVATERLNVLIYYRDLGTVHFILQELPFICHCIWHLS